ncbi:MAG: efflux RND transporter periplasmic adaptor subunit [Myxococcales bacterium]|nr:efflux RND transporter periplasmic adaptor subunit [Myxococcales bacterium]
MRRAVAVLAAAAFVLCACGRTKKPEPTPDPAPAASHATEKEHDVIPRRAKLTKEVMAAAKIQTARAAREALTPTLALPGEVSADPDRSARVSSPVAGRLVDVRFREGSEVKKGEVLAVLRIPEIGRVRAAHKATQAKATSARTNAERLESLSAKGLAAKQEAVSARAEADALDAEAKALGEQLGALGMGTAGGGSDLILRAPVTGTVVSRDAVVGQPVSTDQTIASIADFSELWFLARVFEKDLGRMTAGASADVVLNAYPAETFEGKVEYIGRQIDPVARTVTARIRVQNRRDMLRLGLFGTARVGTRGERAGEAVLVVPRAAIVELAGKTVVFVKVGEGEFETHDVTIGESAGGKVRILSGLREGEEVVVEGAFTVKSVLLRGTLADED